MISDYDLNFYLFVDKGASFPGFVRVTAIVTVPERECLSLAAARWSRGPGGPGAGGDPPRVEADAVDAGEPDRPQPGHVRVVVTDEREPPGHVDVHLRGG